jgi:hypothetical protein
MDDVLMRIIENMLGRIDGPMQFRVYLQPVMASIFAITSGLADAKAGKVPYFWNLLSDAEHRIEIVRDGWKSVGKVFILALVLDVVYQFIVLRFVYPGEAIIVALILAIIPYIILRGLTTRLARLADGG